MEQQEELKKKKRLSPQEINLVILQQPNYYQTYLRKALEEGDSLEQALEYLKDFNL